MEIEGRSATGGNGFGEGIGQPIILGYKPFQQRPAAVENSRLVALPVDQVGHIANEIAQTGGVGRPLRGIRTQHGQETVTWTWLK